MTTIYLRTYAYFKYYCNNDLNKIMRIILTCQTETESSKDGPTSFGVPNHIIIALKAFLSPLG